MLVCLPFFISNKLGVYFAFRCSTAALVGRSIPQENLDKINAELESDIMIRAIHDVKGIDMGNSLVRYKVNEIFVLILCHSLKSFCNSRIQQAEMDFDGRELTRVYLDKQDLNFLLDEIKTFQTIDELETFMLKHGENIVDLMGGEIDRIEMKLRVSFKSIVIETQSVLDFVTKNYYSVTSFRSCLVKL